MFSFKMMDAIFTLSEEKGLPIPEVIAACENVLNAEELFEQTGNIAYDFFDKEIYNHVMDIIENANH